jgi:hypothetical protein
MDVSARVKSHADTNRNNKKQRYKPQNNNRPEVAHIINSNWFEGQIFRALRVFCYYQGDALA